MNRFNVGDVVEWAPGSPGDASDHDKYPGKIEAVNEDGTYKVLFDPDYFPMLFRRVDEGWIQPKVTD